MRGRTERILRWEKTMKGEQMPKATQRRRKNRTFPLDQVAEIEHLTQLVSMNARSWDQDGAFVFLGHLRDRCDEVLRAER